MSKRFLPLSFICAPFICAQLNLPLKRRNTGFPRVEMLEPRWQFQCPAPNISTSVSTSSKKMQFQRREPGQFCSYIPIRLVHETKQRRETLPTWRANGKLASPRFAAAMHNAEVATLDLCNLICNARRPTCLRTSSSRDDGEEEDVAGRNRRDDHAHARPCNNGQHDGQVFHFACNKRASPTKNALLLPRVRATNLPAGFNKISLL